MKKILIIGNKPYRNFIMDDVINSFERNIRCNLGLPNNNNGNKYDRLGLCSHLHHYLIKKNVSQKEFISIYKDDYNIEFINDFFVRFDPKNFKKVFHAKGNKPFKLMFNIYLKLIGSPIILNKMGRTGINLIMTSLLKNKKPYITNFTIDINEERESFYVLKEKFESHYHNKDNELALLRWLHKKNYIDISLCCLEDNKNAIMDCATVLPSVEIINRILKKEPFVLLKNFSEHNLDDIKSTFNASFFEKKYFKLKIK